MVPLMASSYCPSSKALREGEMEGGRDGGRERWREGEMEGVRKGAGGKEVGGR